MPVNAPIPLERQLALVDLLMLPVGASVVDLGCGTGELALTLADRGHSVVGVDTNAELLTTARLGARSLEVRFVEADAKEFPLEASDLVAAIGADHAFGSDRTALAALLTAVHASGSRFALLGLGFHRPPVPAAYEDFLGSLAGIERTHAENVFDAEAAGFRCLHATTATQQEWDEFEWSHYRNRGRKEWRDAYLRWGREVMGFGLYLLARDDA